LPVLARVPTTEFTSPFISKGDTMIGKWIATGMLILFFGVPSGFAREATWADINDVKDKVSSRLSDIKSQLSYQISDLRSEISRLRSELRDLRSELAKAKNEFKAREPRREMIEREMIKNPAEAAAA